MSDVTALITEYLSAGGLFNPELMQHDKVRDMVIQCRDEIESLRSRLAEADALLREMLAWKVAIECIAPELGGAIMTLVRIDAHLARKP